MSRPDATLLSAPEEALALLDRLAGTELLVVGDALLDVHLHGAAERLSREAPVPVVGVEEVVEAPGGAANAAANAAALGARVRLVSVVGDDAEGARLVALLQAAGVDCADVIAEAGRVTVVKTRVHAGEQCLVRFDRGTSAAPAPALARRLVAAVRAGLPTADAGLLSDYGGAVATPAVLRALAARRADGPLVLADGRRASRWAPARPDVVTPSWDEAQPLLAPGAPAAGADRAALVVAEAERLLTVTGASLAAVTLDRDGAVLVGRDRPPQHTPAPRRLAGARPGAGDAFAATLALGLAAGGPPATAVVLATTAATVAVERGGTALTEPVRLRSALAG
jgi:rfaE bifunctional protein kinase chain/domain